MHRRSRKASLLGSIMILSLWAISVGMIASGVASDLETLRLPV